MPLAPARISLPTSDLSLPPRNHSLPSIDVSLPRRNLFLPPWKGTPD